MLPETPPPREKSADEKSRSHGDLKEKSQVGVVRSHGC
jgi:hypothetical protein